MVLSVKSTIWKIAVTLLVLGVVTTFIVVVTIAFVDKWSAPRIGPTITAATGLLTMAGLFFAFYQNNANRREQVAEQREAEYRRQVDHEVEYRRRCVEAVGRILSEIASCTAEYAEMSANLSGYVSQLQEGSIGADEARGLSQRASARFRDRWRLAQSQIDVDLMIIPSLASFAQYSVSEMGKVVDRTIGMEDFTLRAINSNLDSWRMAANRIDYFKGSAAVNFVPTVHAVEQSFHDPGSGYRIDPETGWLVGPNFPDLGRRTDRNRKSAVSEIRLIARWTLVRRP